MKYKVGDIVKLRDDLEVGKDYGIGLCFVESMKHLKRKPIVIEACEKESFGEWYRVEDCFWIITDEMIEGLWEECKPKNATQIIFETMNNNDNFPKKPLKLIDILNKIAKGELKEGTKVKWDIFEYTYREDEFKDECLERKDSDNKTIDILEDMYLRHLDAEVELIEPECKHEWYLARAAALEKGKITQWIKCKKCGAEEEREVDNPAEKIEELDVDSFYDNIKGYETLDFEGAVLGISDKLNEVIRYINKGELVRLN